MLKSITDIRTILTAGLLFALSCGPASAFVCSGSMYNSPAFEQRVSDFSPYEKIYLIIECIGLEPGEYTMRANWTHQQRGMIRSDTHSFIAEKRRKHGVFFWFKLSRKGPVASMLSNQDFHEENFGEWLIETYLNDKLIVSNEFTITDD